MTANHVPKPRKKAIGVTAEIQESIRPNEGYFPALPLSLRQAPPPLVEAALPTTHRDIVPFDNPSLHKRIEPIEPSEIPGNPEVQRVINRLGEVFERQPNGVGIAANQIGEDLRVAIINIDLPPEVGVEPWAAVIINPSYGGVGEAKPFPNDGCMSCGSGGEALVGTTMRYYEIKATWYDANGERQEETLTGLPAIVFQHETDHLDGMVFSARVKDPGSYMTVTTLMAQRAINNHDG